MTGRCDAALHLPGWPLTFNCEKVAGHRFEHVETTEAVQPDGVSVQFRVEWSQQ